MMSKASFMMQDQLRHNYSLITDIFYPNAFIVRGRLPFPQGLSAISILFRHKRPADVYAHPYFVEKQSDPNQPSPQLHITEESQGIMKVIGGLRYMRDDNSKLDNTMFVVTDYQVNAEGRMLTLDSSTSRGEGSQADGTGAGDDDDDGVDSVVNKTKVGHERQHVSAQVSETFSAAREAARRRAEEAMGQHAAGSFSGAGATVATAGSSSSVSDIQEAAFNRSKGSVRGRTSFPTPEDSSSDPQVNCDFFQLALESARGSGGSAPGLAGRMHGDESAKPTFPLREGAYTVLYNPIETNEKSFINLIRKLEKEERVVKAIVIPTRQAWRHIQLWADAFPDAEIISSGEIPIASAPEEGQGAGVAATATGNSSSGLQDFGNGVTGLSFPEVDLEAIAAEEARCQQELASGKRMTVKGGSSTSSTREGSGKRAANTHEDPVDVLWDDASLLLDPSAHVFVGLRAADKSRVRVLCHEAEKEAAAAAMKRAEPSADVPFHHCVRLTPRIELLHVEGDAIANEYVLYDAHSGTLACTDLYHGGYADLDPVNSWMCRVWFKFMKSGDHKRADIVPRFKWRQVCGQGTLRQMQECVHRLTTTRPIWSLIYAHGTPPRVTDAASALRVQWGLPPLTEAQQQCILAQSQRSAGEVKTAPVQAPGAGQAVAATAALHGGNGAVPPLKPPHFAVGDQLAGAELKDE